MKKITMLFVAVGAMLALTTASMAQGPGPSGPPPGQGGPGGAGGRRGGGMMKMTADILAKMDLTKDQKKQLKTLEKTMAGDMKAMREKMNLTKGTRPTDAQRTEMRASMMKMNKSFHDGLAKILTPDQLKAFEKAVAEARSKMGAWGRGPGGPGGRPGAGGPSGR